MYIFYTKTKKKNMDKELIDQYNHLRLLSVNKFHCKFNKFLQSNHFILMAFFNDITNLYHVYGLMS